MLYILIALVFRLVCFTYHLYPLHFKHSSRPRHVVWCDVFFRDVMVLALFKSLPYTIVDWIYCCPSRIDKVAFSIRSVVVILRARCAVLLTRWKLAFILNKGVRMCVCAGKCVCLALGHGRPWVDFNVFLIGPLSDELMRSAVKHCLFVVLCWLTSLQSVVSLAVSPLFVVACLYAFKRQLLHFVSKVWISLFLEAPFCKF